MKQPLILFLLLILSININAQKINGKVIDANTKIGIPFATVTVENVGKGKMA